MKKIGIILLNYNGTKDTIACIESIEKSDVEHMEIKVIVIDNSSNAEEVAELKKYINDIRMQTLNDYNEKYIFIENKLNLGFAGANNKAIRYAEENYNFDYYLLLNNDTELKKDSLSNLLEAFNDPQVGAASGLVLDFNTKSKIWYSGGYISKLKCKGIHENYGKDISLINLKKKETKFLSGCYVMFDRNALCNIQLLNERYFFGTEEYDYSLKLKRMGYKLMFIPNSIIYHKVDINEGNGSSHDIKELIYIYNSMRNKYILNSQNFNIISNMAWVIMSKIYIRYFLFKRLKKKNSKTYISERSIKILYENYKINIGKKFIDNKEFNDVRKKLI